MVRWRPLHVQSGSESGWSSSATFNALLAGALQQPGHQLVHRAAANAGTENMTQDALSAILCWPEISKNNEQHAIGCEYIHSVFNGRQLTI